MRPPVQPALVPLFLALLASVFLAAWLLLAKPAHAQEADPAKALTVGGTFSQFGQFAPEDGWPDDFVYGGRLDVHLKLDFHELGLWKNGSLDAKAATRYGHAATAA